MIFINYSTHQLQSRVLNGVFDLKCEQMTFEAAVLHVLETAPPKLDDLPPLPTKSALTSLISECLQFAEDFINGVP